MRNIGCVLFLLVIAFITLEIWVYIQVAAALDEYLGVALAIGACTFFGYRLVRWQAARMPAALMQNRMGQQGLAIFGAALISFPGIVSTVIGLILQLPPVQAMFANITAKVVAALIRVAASRMPGGMPGAGGMPGGFQFPGGMMGGMGMGRPGKGGPQFPGMQPDQKLKGGRVIDTKAERKD